MVTPTEYLTITTWLGVFAAMFLLWVFVARKIVHRQFWCPWKGTSVDVDFVTNRWTGKAVEVASCSAFGEAGVPVCDRICLGMSFPEHFSFKRRPRNQKKEAKRVEAERDVRRWLF
jgi:hypothetical protein